MNLDTVPECDRTPFVPVATMFKLPEPDSRSVQCVACGTEFPLSDLLTGELEEEECPRCHTDTRQYWVGKPHRELEN